MDKQAREAREAVKSMSFLDRLKHFWYYNKLKVIVIITLIAVVSYTIFQLVTAEKYDLEVAYYGEREFTEEQIESFKQYLSENIEDINGDGKKNVQFTVVTYTQQQTINEYGMAINQKFMMELSAGTAYAYIVSPDFYGALNSESWEGIADSVLELKDSKAYGEILGETEDERWITKSVYEKEQGKEENKLLHNNALLAENALRESE
ncbi:MAG: hypothetical protein ACI4RS_03945 [Monoglobaceae bacterium]